MPWAGPAGRRYYYLSLRVNSRPHTIYLGNGPAAEAAAAEVERRKAERARRAAERDADQRKFDLAVAPLLDLVTVTDRWSKTALFAEGYYQHSRGEWRRRRVPYGRDSRTRRPNPPQLPR